MTERKTEPKDEQAFSDELEQWLDGDEHKTFGEMSDVFGERGFAVTIVLALSLPALPIPTGGITHVFEAVAVLLAVEMILGRRTMWLPRRVRERELGPTLANRALPFIVKRIRWLEKYSRRRGAAVFRQRWFLRVIGLVVVAFAIGSAVAPPFSGLDTLPALGAVVVALSILLEDVVVLVVGLLIGTGGIALIITIGAALAHFIRGLF
jgi:hypothetical protein